MTTAGIGVAKHPPNTVFVFGSNLAGRHGKGAALEARDQWGAVPGVGQGRTGRCYALPTKDEALKPLSLERIRSEVMRFMLHAAEDQESDFLVTRVGCGLAGYTEEQIAPMFRPAPDNCNLPVGWREIADASGKRFRQMITANGEHPWTGAPGWDVLRVAVRSDVDHEAIEEYIGRATEMKWRLFMSGELVDGGPAIIFYRPHGSHSDQWLDLRP